LKEKKWTIYIFLILIYKKNIYNKYTNYNYNKYVIIFTIKFFSNIQKYY